MHKTVPEKLRQEKSLKVSEKLNIPTVTEVMDTRDVKLVVFIFIVYTSLAA